MGMIAGDPANSSARSINAAPTRPERWAWRPASLENALKMPKVDGPRRIAN
jgi:hypothetical protein